MMMRFTGLPKRDDAVIALVTDCQSRGQPILVGTVTIENQKLFLKR